MTEKYTEAEKQNNNVVISESALEQKQLGFHSVTAWTPIRLYGTKLENMFWLVNLFVFPNLSEPALPDTVDKKVLRCILIQMVYFTSKSLPCYCGYKERRLFCN